MANKKFYYRNRNKNKKSSDDALIKEQLSIYSKEQLELTLDALGICQSTTELLLKYRIQTAQDLVKRTEKDMYRVQGLNKKILLEVREALKAHGMDFRIEAPVAAQNDANASKPAQVKQQPKQKDNKKQNKVANQTSADKQQNVEIVENSQDIKRSKFGLADKKVAVAKPQTQSNQPNQKQKNAQKKETLSDGELRKVMKGGKWGYSNGSKIVIPTMYDEIFAFKEGLASVEINEKCGFIDEQNNVVIPLEYDTAMSFSQGLAMVVKGTKCGYINKNNEVVIPFEYDAATPFENGESKVKKDGKWGTLTLDNKIVWI